MAVVVAGHQASGLGRNCQGARTAGRIARAPGASTAHIDHWQPEWQVVGRQIGSGERRATLQPEDN